MTREDLRLKLQILLDEFHHEHKLDAEETHTIATTMITLMYSNRETMLIWYKEMQRVSDMIAKNLKEQADRIIDTLNLSDEEKEKLMQRVKAQIKKGDKVEN
jgi:hypothetical protein